MNFFFRIAFLLLLGTSQMWSQNDTANSGREARSQFFIENKGQLVDSKGNMCPDIQYYSCIPSGTVYLSPNRVSYVTSQLSPKPNTITESDERSMSDTGLVQISIQRIDLNFIGANQSACFKAEEKLSESFNYYYAHCPQGVTDVCAYQCVIVNEIYPGIDAKYRKDAGGLKYDLIVKPNADPSAVKIQYEGYENLVVEKGQIYVEGQFGKIIEKLPIVYQVIKGKTIPVRAWYEFTDNSKKVIGIRTESYDKNYELIIDPWATWITFLGGSYGDEGNAVATDTSGNIFITGFTQSLDFPVLNGFQMAWVYWADAFLSKFNSSGNLMWSTYYGATGNDEPFDVCVDNSGNVAIAGWTNATNFPVSGAYQASSGGNYDCYLVKFNNSGIRQWATYLGGSGVDIIFGLEADNSGNVYLCGESASNNFPRLNAFQSSYGGFTDAIFGKFNSSGSLIWSTYFGGTGTDSGRGVTVLPGGDIAFSGQTQSNNLPILNAFQGTRVGGWDAFLARFSSGGSRLWATYFGGSANEYGYDVSSDLSGNIYFSGYTNSTNLPVFGGFQMTYGGVGDAYVAKFTSMGMRVWATYVGGADHEESFGIAVNAATGVIYLTGTTPGLGFPATTGACQQLVTGVGADHFLTSISPSCNVICSTFIGGPSDEVQSDGHRIALHGGFAYLANYVSSDYPVNSGYQMIYGGPNYDAGLAQIPTNCGCSPAFSITQAPTAPNCNSQCNASAIAIASGGTAPYTYSWSPTVSTSAIANNLCAGTYTCIVTDALSASDTVTFTVTQAPQLTASTSISNSISCYSNCNGGVSASASGGIPGYSYAWNSVPPQYSVTASNLCAGTYSVTVVDQIGCTTTQSVVLTQPAAFSVSFSTNPSSCSAATGSATVTATGGTAPYSYNWSPSGGTGNVATNLQVGAYSCLITDANGCSNTSTVAIAYPYTVSASVSSVSNVTCFGQGNGSITMTASNGTAPYTYNWTPTGGNSATANNLIPSTYTCTITDNAGCTATQTATITQPSALSVSISTTASACSSNTGAASVSSSGGVPGYTFFWSPSGLTTPSVNGLPAGTFTITVTDANGCSISDIDSITYTVAPTVSINPQNVTCFGYADGTATAQVLGSGPFTYYWFPVGGTSVSATNLSPQTYTVTVTDANGCTAVQSVLITEPAPLVLSINSSAGVTCYGSCDGAVSWSATGGTPTYQLPSANALCGGQQTLIMTDAFGCADSALIMIPSPATPLTLLLTGNDTICAGESDTLYASATGGWQPVYSFNWQPGNVSTDSLFINPSLTGTFTCTVTDSAGCTDVQPFLVYVNAAPVITMDLSATDTLCINSAIVTLSASPGGGVFSGTGVSGNQFSPSVAGAGNHAITYTYQDSNSCFATGVDTIWVDFCARIDGQQNTPACLKIYPNYVHDYFFYENCSVGALKLYNPIGELILSQAVYGYGQIDVSMLSTGIYLIVVETPTAYSTQKLVIIK